MLVAALLLFALPLAVVVRGLLVDRALDELQGRLEQAALLIDQRARTCGEIQLFVAAAGGETTRLTLWRDGEVIAASSGQPTVVADELTEARAGRMGRSYVADRLAVATPLATPRCGGATVLRATEPAAGLERSIRNAWLALGGVGLAVLALAAGVAIWQGRRLARPFERLAGDARRLGEGDFSVRPERSGLPEADAIAEALDTTADRLGRAVQRARAFTADASHQLRTPLTALRLQLEGLATAGADPGAVAAALEEADRLEATIDELVALTDVEGPEMTVDPALLVEERAGVWRSLAEETGREFNVEVVPCNAVRVRPAAVGQALQVLLDNAFEHGEGPVTVRVGPSLPDDEDGGVRICVLDEGPGMSGSPAGRREADRGGGPLPLTGGRGLVLARSLVEGEGGRLVVGSTGSGTRACIVLPVA